MALLQTVWTCHILFASGRSPVSRRCLAGSSSSLWEPLVFVEESLPHKRRQLSVWHVLGEPLVSQGVQLVACFSVFSTAFEEMCFAFCCRTIPLEALSLLSDPVSESKWLSFEFVELPTDLLGDLLRE